MRKLLVLFIGLVLGTAFYTSPVKAESKTLTVTPKTIEATLEKIKNNDANHRYTLIIKIEDCDDYSWICYGGGNYSEWKVVESLKLPGEWYGEWYIEGRIIEKKIITKPGKYLDKEYYQKMLLKQNELYEKSKQSNEDEYWSENFEIEREIRAIENPFYSVLQGDKSLYNKVSEKHDKVYLEKIIWDVGKSNNSFSFRDLSDLCNDGLVDLKDKKTYIQGKSMHLGHISDCDAVINVNEINNSSISIGSSVTINNAKISNTYINDGSDKLNIKNSILNNVCIDNKRSGVSICNDVNTVLSNCTISGSYRDYAHDEDGYITKKKEKISFLYGYAKFNNCRFSNCKSDTRGGVVQGAGQFTNCTFSNCSAKLYGGVVYTYVTEEQAKTYKTEFKNCTFKYCKATKGGGVAYVKDSNYATFTGGSFIGNRAGTKGGAIYNGGIVYLKNYKGKAIKFLGNNSKSGGTLYDDAGTWKVTKAVKKKLKILTTGYSLSGPTKIKLKKKKSKTIRCKIKTPTVDKLTKTYGMKEKYINTFTYKSSRSSVAKISKFGKLMAKKKGTAIISVYCKGTPAIIKRIVVTVK